ncbi:MAG: NUDIX domain-containing protein [Clostridiales bacterium]|nr:NUDIX domain-containing protein [Clostridiales bacterium]
MERFDTFDDERIRTGNSYNRGEKCPKGENRLVVHILVFNSKNEMLIQRRVDDKKVYPGLWDFSCGGNSMSGETSKETAHRELLEELGIDYDFSQHRPHLTINFENGFDDYYFIEKDIDIDKIVIQEEEVAEVKWATKDDIVKLRQENKLIPYVESFIPAVFDMRGKRGLFD